MHVQSGGLTACATPEEEASWILIGERRGEDEDENDGGGC